MGYTHYFNDRKPINDKQWLELQKHTYNLFVYAYKHNDNIVNGNGDINTMPCIDNDSISFNGSGNEAYETGYLSRTTIRSEFCKTARQPYDVYVVAFYYIAEYLNLGMFSSDGNELETSDGKQLANYIINMR